MLLLILVSIVYHSSELFIHTDNSVVWLIMIVIGDALIVFRCWLYLNSIFCDHTIAERF